MAQAEERHPLGVSTSSVSSSAAELQARDGGGLDAPAARRVA